MPRYDHHCTAFDCHWAGEIWRKAFEPHQCPMCGHPTERYWPQGAQMHGVIDDALPGGPQWIENLGHAPVWVETKSQLKAEADARGLQQFVRHTPVPGTDKSPHTTKWF